MKTVKSAFVSGFLFALASLLGYAATNVLPGVQYCDPPTELRGRLVFLYSTNGYWAPKAHIYEFDLEKKSLLLVTESPGGDFDVAKDGQTFCVRHGIVNGFGLFITNAFIYSKRLNQSRAVAFEKQSSQVTFAEDHVFFHFDRRVFDYDIVTRLLTPVSLAGEKAPEPVASHSPVRLLDDRGFDGFRAPTGRWIFFEGGDGPLQGTRLVSSALNEFDTHYDNPKGNNVRVLRRFSRPLRGSYNLEQLSPCGRFALVRRSSPIGDDWAYTYYVIDIEDGDMQLLIEDKVCTIGGARMSYIHWVAETSTTR